VIEIKLPGGSWNYEEQDMLGPPGGFGAVFRGRGADGRMVAVKRLQSIYQSREMRIADYLLGHGLAHVIPIFDAGFDADAATNFIVMPIAEMSLQQHIAASGPLGETETLKILAAIAAGLDEIGDIIHRDLKPGNILLHEGVWKLADLGLARFAEAATSMNTMREALTPPYAAPEQWRGERPTKATDVYALGCIVHALLQGAPPFAGPTAADYSHQHQFVAAPGLNATPHLKRLTASCLAKAPELRPSISSLRKQLVTALEAISTSRANRLAAAGAAVLERAAQEEEQRLRMVREQTRRKQIAAEAVEQLKAIFEELEAAVLRDAPNAKVGTASRNSKLRSLTLGDAELEYGIPFPEIESGGSYPYTGNGYRMGSRTWDLFVGGFLGVKTWGPAKGQSANLWFGRLLKGDDYGWWEVSYVQPANIDPGNNPGPFGMDERFSSFSAYLVARDPQPITPESQDAFLNRWIDLFAQFAETDHLTLKALYPGRFKRQKVSRKFNLDEP
jgi:hypothetical protein